MVMRTSKKFIYVMRAPNDIQGTSIQCFLLRIFLLINHNLHINRIFPKWNYYLIVCYRTKTSNKLHAFFNFFHSVVIRMRCIVGAAVGILFWWCAWWIYHSSTRLIKLTIIVQWFENQWELKKETHRIQIFILRKQNSHNREG